MKNNFNIQLKKKKTFITTSLIKYERVKTNFPINQTFLNLDKKVSEVNFKYLFY